MIRGYAPFLGEHNEEILSQELHYSEEMIASLYQEHLLHQALEAKGLPEELQKNKPWLDEL